MGIERNVALAVIREHAYRPIMGDVLLIGRQTMFFSPQDAMGMLKECGLEVPTIHFRADSKTRLANQKYLSDDDFFRLLGIEKLKALDVSDYEGADIIHDLTAPLPSQLEGAADFILDGSTLDNVFDPATALRNYARLLKLGGRIVSINVGSNHYDPYLMLTPLWVLDYFAINNFADCKAYLLVYDVNGGMNAFTPDLDVLRGNKPQLNNISTTHSMVVVFVAEKEPYSTWDRTPVQHQYRADWKAHDDGIARFKMSKRPEPFRSTADGAFAKSGWLYVDKNGMKSGAPIVDRPVSFSQRIIRRARGVLR